MFKSFSISRLTAPRRSALEQAFHSYPTLLSELRRRAVSASELSSHIPLGAGVCRASLTR